MGKVLKAILNNLNENTYIKNKRFLKLQEKGTKDPIIYPKDSREWQTIEHCETSVRHNNLKVYLKNMLKLRGK